MIETCGKDKSDRVWIFRSKDKKRFQPKVTDPINICWIYTLCLPKRLGLLNQVRHLIS